MALITVWLSANLFGYEMLKEALKIREAYVAAIMTLSGSAKTKMYDGIDRSKWYEFKVPVYEVEDINKEISVLKLLSPDMVMMCGWRQLLSKEVLNVPKIGVIGFHPTLLPKGRGPAPIINTILEGFQESGVTMLHIDESLDGGDIIGQASFKVGYADYAMDICSKVVEAGRNLIRIYLPLLAEGEAPRIPQDESEATYFRKRTLKDNEIRYEVETIEEIYRKIRALSKPYKGAYIKAGDKKLIIWRAELTEVHNE